MGKPTISTRRWICWNPQNGGQPTEPTTTLVLTSPAGRYVDIRILKPKDKSEPELPNQGGPMSRLEWAFAGASEVREPLGPGQPHRAKWIHWIDSNVIDSPEEEVRDEGLMFPNPDNPNESLETGKMVNPATGQSEEYQEAWSSLPVMAVGDDPSTYSVVLQLDDPKARARGMIVRAGQFCQGVLRIGDEVSVEQWRYRHPQKANGSEGPTNRFHENWERVIKLGRLYVPCSFTFRAQEIQVQNELHYNNYTWVVVEHWKDQSSGV